MSFPASLLISLQRLLFWTPRSPSFQQRSCSCLVARRLMGYCNFWCELPGLHTSTSWAETKTHLKCLLHLWFQFISCSCEVTRLFAGIGKYTGALQWWSNLIFGVKILKDFCSYAPVRREHLHWVQELSDLVDNTCAKRRVSQRGFKGLSGKRPLEKM